mmetsp:Transcript_100601/g.174692  ORF Transcript_100601/g.174692 Transcript_100601/m.174692 type:complete len:204 (-) Transcript_100601:43-654(-)
MGNGCNQCSDADAGPQEMVYTATYADIVHARETSLLMQPYDAQDINRGQEVEFAWDPANPELSQYMLATVAINIERQLEMQDRMIKKLLEDSDAEEARLRALTDVADNEASASSDNAADANGDAQPPLVDLSGASTASPPGAHAGADSRRDGALHVRIDSRIGGAQSAGGDKSAAEQPGNAQTASEAALPVSNGTGNAIPNGG